MNWKDYEVEIASYFKEQFPNTEITHNASVDGRYSKTKRQIDILIEDYVAGNRIRIVIDGKFFSKKIDVKDVEMFIGMLNDCEANKGLLITQQGFSPAAINRAFSDPIDIELDILNFKDLKDFQGFEGIIYSGKSGAIVTAPFGWILDGTRREGILASFYQRGLSFEEAGDSKEFMYVNLIAKDADT
ncbi:restriction endonuclease [Hymenobacter terricola]|uniref:restriction endonuclease n=1 Tax=Hymenobacter terricola TaxID=2819236 RepID=UPI001B30F931|nr:restriction endonuclease [Hymenobacter terricola]